jgi:hypothetical protein
VCPLIATAQKRKMFAEIEQQILEANPEIKVEAKIGRQSVQSSI